MDKLELIIGVAFFISIALLIDSYVNALQKEREEWAAFKAQHHCRVSSVKSAKLFTTVNSDGKTGIGSTPGEVGWLCDDGVVYYRSGDSNDD